MAPIGPVATTAIEYQVYVVFVDIRGVGAPIIEVSGETSVRDRLRTHILVNSTHGWTLVTHVDHISGQYSG